MIRQDLVNKIWHGIEPISLNTPIIDTDIQGWWGSEHPYLLDSIVKTNAQIIVEVGVWKGKSAIFMADFLKKNNIDAVVICVDTWLGGWDHWIDKQWFDDLKIKNGYPSIYETFISNVKNAGVEDCILPIPIDSIGASKILKNYNIEPDVIHLDASHDYASVKSDLTEWWPLLKPGGYFIGDDYDPYWPGVTQAFDEFFVKEHIEIGGQAKCRIKKQ